jgi:hypothetical protein
MHTFIVKDTNIAKDETKTPDQKSGVFVLLKDKEKKIARQ